MQLLVKLLPEQQPTLLIGKQQQVCKPQLHSGAPALGMVHTQAGMPLLKQLLGCQRKESWPQLGLLEPGMALAQCRHMNSNKRPCPRSCSSSSSSSSSSLCSLRHMAHGRGQHGAIMAPQTQVHGPLRLHQLC